MSGRFVRLCAVLVLSAGAQSLALGQPSAPRAPKPAIVTPADSALDAETRSLATQLRCPVCQGLSVQDSPSELAQQMRDVVRQQLQDGKSPDEVKQYFVARYGEWILMAPPASGFNWLVYSLPVIVLAIGVAFLIVIVRRWTSAPRDAAPPATPNPSHTMH
ncbi:MAG TPA: cytochrome c-type biogenesis protein [Gemmatimonadaceae bacterium]|nr:cytochrome c-type biogenesis protein [Gemmatimonadaceae bacterium]